MGDGTRGERVASDDGMGMRCKVAVGRVAPLSPILIPSRNSGGDSNGQDPYPSIHLMQKGNEDAWHGIHGSQSVTRVVVCYQLLPISRVFMEK